MTRPQIVVVDPETADRQATVETLEAAGFLVESAPTIEDAKSTLDTAACVVTEYTLPDGTAFELLQLVRERNPDALCLIFADITLEEMETERADGEIAEFLPKGTPNARELLLELVEHGTEARTQTSYPLPADEQERLDAIRQYVPDPAAAEVALDRLTRIGAALFDTQIASIGVIDTNEQRFLSCHGIDIDGTPREESICTYAILDEEVTVIEDIEADPRFDREVVLGSAEIRFYASANLTTPAGETIGTFCVYDDEPRQFSKADREHLQLLAEEAMEQLNLRRQLRERGETDD